MVPKMRFALALSSRANALVHFQEGHTALQIPKIICGWLSFDIPVHGALEQDRAHNSVTVKAGAGDDARAHLMHEGKHLFVVGPRAFLDTVSTQRLGGAATALVQRSKEAGLGFDFSLLLFLQARRVHKLFFGFQ